MSDSPKSTQPSALDAKKAAGPVPDERTCAQYLADAVVGTGCKTVFALAGATTAPLLFALEDRGVTIVGGRHESGTVGGADGYARRTGRTGFALIVSEQAMANAMTALLTAAQAETPLVVIATRFPDNWIEPAIQYEVDRHELTAPFLKFSRTVPSPERLGDYIYAAIKAANEGVPGPAVLVVPLDMLGAPCPSAPRPTPLPLPLPAPQADTIEQIAALLGEAQRPIVVTDNRAIVTVDLDQCSTALTALAAMGVPVLGNGLGRGLAPEHAPLGYPWPFAQAAAAEADLVIIVGARMNMWFGYGLSPRFGAEARFVHIDPSAEAIGRNRAVDLGVVADPGRALSALVAKLETVRFRRDPAWLAAGLAPREAAIGDLLDRYGDGLHAATIGDVLDKTLPETRILVCDGADSMNFTHARMRVHTPRSYADLLPFGAMGTGFPIAVGMAAGEAELATDDGRAPQHVTFVTGDGAFGFFIAELDTVARAALPLIVLVSNDGRWGTEFHGQALAYGRVSNTDLGKVDHAGIARAFNCGAARVKTRTELEAAVSAALSAGGPTLIDVLVDPDGGRVRKTDPLLGLILFEDIARN